MRAIPGVDTDTIESGLIGVDEDTGVVAKLEGDTGKKINDCRADNGEDLPEVSSRQP